MAEKTAAPCGLYCGACIYYLVNRSCHGCGCECGDCDALDHHKKCDIFKCCVEQKGHKACCDCVDFPCSILIRFCHDPVWLYHSSVIENLQRRKAIGIRKWLEEQEQTWSNTRYLKRWLWFQKQCKNRLLQSMRESKCNQLKDV